MNPSSKSNATSNLSHEKWTSPIPKAPQAILKTNIPIYRDDKFISFNHVEKSDSAEIPDSSDIKRARKRKFTNELLQDNEISKNPKCTIIKNFFKQPHENFEKTGYKGTGYKSISEKINKTSPDIEIGETFFYNHVFKGKCQTGCSEAYKDFETKRDNYKKLKNELLQSTKTKKNGSLQGPKTTKNGLLRGSKLNKELRCETIKNFFKKPPENFKAIGYETISRAISATSTTINIGKTFLKNHVVEGKEKCKTGCSEAYNKYKNQNVTDTTDSQKNNDIFVLDDFNLEGDNTDIV